MGYTCKDENIMLIERIEKKNESTRNNNGKGF